MKKKKRITKLCIYLVFVLCFNFIYFPASKTLAMELMPDSSITYIEFKEYLNKYNRKSNIDIQIIGNIDIDSNITIETIDENANLDKINETFINTTENEVYIQEATQIEDQYIEKKEFNIENIKKLDNIDFNSTKTKTNKNQLMSFIISDDKREEFFEENNHKDINDSLRKGYTILFEVDNMYESDEVFYKLGLLDRMLDTYNLDESKQSDLEKQIVASYITYSLDGNYCMGTIYSNEYNEDLLLFSAFKIKNYYIYTDNKEEIKESSQTSILSPTIQEVKADDSSPMPEIGDNWIRLPAWREYIFYNIGLGYTYGNTCSDDAAIALTVRSYYYYYNQLIPKPNNQSGTLRYFASATTLIATPNLSGTDLIHTQYVRYTYKADEISNANLHSYAPTTNVPSGSVTINAGISSEPTVDAGISTSWDIGGVTLENNSNLPNNKVDVKWNYNGGIFNASYRTSETIQKAIVIASTSSNNCNIVMTNRAAMLALADGAQFVFHTDTGGVMEHPISMLCLH